jgi:hypothetical protein
MKKYTQRELQNEAFRDMLKGMARGVGRVAKEVPGAIGSGIITSMKNVAKHISPELYNIGKKARDIYNTPIKGHLEKNRMVTVYKRGTSIDNILNGSEKISFNTSTGNAIKARLVFTGAGKEEDIGDGLTKIPFTASSKDYIAYIDKTDKNNPQVLAIQEA